MKQRNGTGPAFFWETFPHHEIDPGRSGGFHARATKVGIEFPFDGITRQPNTLAAHQLIRAAAAASCEDAMVESLFRGYFLEGADLTKRAALVELAARAGLAGAQAAVALDDTRLRVELAQEEHQPRSLGVERVPFFIMGGRVGVSGAQDPDVLVQAIEQALGHAA